MSRSRTLDLVAVTLALGLGSSIAVADDDTDEDFDDGGALPIEVGGFLQPQLMVRQDSEAEHDHNGARFRRARLNAKAHRTTQDVELSAHLEAELLPGFQLLDAYVSVDGDLPKKGHWRIDLGQVKAPFSRQELLSDTRLAFVEKAEVASLAPSWQIGGRVGIALPFLPMVELWGGAFNGEGRNQVENLDQSYLFVGRVEVKPLGRDVELAESGFHQFITIGASVARNEQYSAGGLEKTLAMGADIAASLSGVSIGGEFTRVKHEFPTDSGTEYQAQGWEAHLAYLLPLPGYLEKKLELGARVEEIDRNDAVPVDAPGHPDQSLRYYTGALSYYHSRHDLKAQLTYSRIDEVEEEDGSGANIEHDNDLLLVQITFRME